jgi:hypothetical protein
MANSPATGLGLSAATDIEQSSARPSILAARQRTAFLDWLGSQIENTSSAVPDSSRPGHSVPSLAPPTMDEILPDRGSFRARGNTPPTVLDDGGTPGFERSTSRIARHLIRYASVPDAAKFPNGPYHQAPAEKGGEWWLVNPFTGPEPWLRLEQIQTSPEEEALPEGFAEIFGSRPTRNEFPDYFEFRLAKMEWEHDIKLFKQAGIPPGLDEVQLEAAKEAFAEWGLGEPAFYEGGHGWRVRFPQSAVRGFEMNPTTAVQAPHIVIAKYQIRLIQQGDVPENAHPWVPPHLLTPGAEA